jgi:preprotein translocase subunit SecG
VIIAIGGLIYVWYVMADTLRIVLMGIFILVCIFLTIVVLMQESKQNGLSGAISGAADTYWGKNKGRSMEGKLVTITKVLAVLFVVIAIILNINF